MKDLLDTNIASELGKPRPHGGVMAWFKSLPVESYAIPSIAIYEIQVGIERTRKQHPERAAELDLWVEKLMQTVTILDLDAASAREAARLVHGKPMELLEDAMIAAIAKVNGLRVATRNTKDFEQFGVPLIDPFLFPKV